MFKILNRRISSPLAKGIIAVLVIVVGSGILWFSTRQEVFIEFPEIKKPEKVIKVIKEETADWKTYGNEEYGFEFEYPKDLIIKKQLEAFWGLDIKESASSSLPVNWKINIAKNQSNATAQDYAEFAGGTGLKEKDITEFTVSGIEGRKVILSFYSDDTELLTELLTNEFTQVFIIKEDFVYTFNCTNRLGNREYDCSRFTHMLSTFNFLEEVKEVERITSFEVLKIEEKFVEKNDREIALLQNGDIWVLSKDLKKKYKLIDGEETIIDFAISPDGEEIYWLNGKEIWKKDSVGDIKLLTKADKIDTEAIKKRWEGVEWVDPKEIEKLESGIKSFKLSPDGKYIVYEEIKDYTSCCAGPPNIPLTWIWIMKTDGTEKVAIERPSGVRKEMIFFDGWLPDGKKILFHFQAADEPTRGSSLFEVGIDGRNPKTVVGSEPVYSPTGEKMAYIKEGSQIRLRDINTKEVKTILESESIPFGLASNIIKWSENGNLLTIAATNKIFIFNKDGEIVYKSEELVKPEKVKYVNYSESGILSPDNKFLGGVYDLLYEKWEKNNIIFLTNLITKERKEFDLTETLKEHLPAEINIYPQFFSKNGKFYYLLELREPEIENGKEKYPLITKETFPQLFVINVDNLNIYKIAENVTQVAIAP